ncbi:MAG: hypothetical protein Q9182_005962 [Xanthomendoza sp. 2 TL-2023]
MHHIKHWAHRAARTNDHNTSVQDTPSTFDNGDNVQSNLEEKEKDKAKLPIWQRFWSTVKKALLNSWINVLLVFVPVGIAVNFAGLSPTIIFAMNAIAIIPLAGLLAFATESVAHRLGDTLGALLNVSFGNAVELIIFIALVKNQIRIVQASLLGSILANLLLILGMAFVVGGLQYQEQVYNSTVTQLSACLLCLAVLSLLIPVWQTTMLPDKSLIEGMSQTAFHASFSDAIRADVAVLKVSRGTSVILLLVYIVYLLFQLKSHTHLYKSTPQHIVDEESHPGILQRMNSSGSSSVTTSSTGWSGASRRGTRSKLRIKLGRKRHQKIEPETKDVERRGSLPTIARGKGKAAAEDPPVARTLRANDPSASSNTRPMGPLRISSLAPPVFRKLPEPMRRSLSAAQLPKIHRLQSGPNSRHGTGLEEKPARRSTMEAPPTDEPPMSKTASVLLLLGSTALVALCAEFMVDSINEFVVNTPLSEAFVGLIILPIVGNAAEHVTAVTVAAKNKMDLAIGVAIGSSIQIATFITPLVVIIGWIMNKDMSLYFTLFETVTLFVATFVGIGKTWPSDG